MVCNLRLITVKLNALDASYHLPYVQQVAAFDFHKDFSLVWVKFSSFICILFEVIMYVCNWPTHFCLLNLFVNKYTTLTLKVCLSVSLQNFEAAIQDNVLVKGLSWEEAPDVEGATKVFKDSHLFLNQ